MSNTTCRFTTGIVLLIGLSLTLAVVLTAPRTARANPGVLYAAPTAQGSGNCSSWANACTLQTALTQAVSGDEIWVKAGVHYPGAAGNRNATFSLKSGVALYGGFAGTETSRDARNWQANVTVLSGDIDQNDLTDANGVVTTTARIVGSNSYHVVWAVNVDNTAVLDGFTITAGQANANYPHYFGGGMYNKYGSPTLRNLIFSGNLAHYVDVGNTHMGLGGGMYNDEGSPSLTNVVFTGNSSAGLGGGMCNDSYGYPTLTNVTFRENSAARGGGMANYEDSHPILTNVVFTDNTASAYGGGMYNDYKSSPTLTNVIFSDNKAYNGGGMYNDDHNRPALRNVVFRNNSASNEGGGMYNDDASHPTLTNVTFYGNTAEAEGGGMSNYDGSNPVLTNVIMWGDTAYDYPEIANYTGSTPVVTYSDIQGGYPGTGNINADPRFVNATSGNLRLQSGSPCIDTGSNAAVPAGVTTDLDGNPRIVDGNGDGNTVVDMGAYEASASPSRKIYLPLVLRNAQ